MFILLIVLERFAHLLPPTLRVEIAAFIADRLLRALDTSAIPLERIASACPTAGFARRNPPPADRRLLSPDHQTAELRPQPAGLRPP